jgi:hypothetical protein
VAVLIWAIVLVSNCTACTELLEEVAANITTLNSTAAQAGTPTDPQEWASLADTAMAWVEARLVPGGSSGSSSEGSGGWAGPPPQYTPTITIGYGDGSDGFPAAAAAGDAPPSGSGSESFPIPTYVQQCKPVVFNTAVVYVSFMGLLVTIGLAFLLRDCCFPACMKCGAACPPPAPWILWLSVGAEVGFALYSVAMYSVAMYSVALYSVALYSVALYSVALYSVAIHWG